MKKIFLFLIFILLTIPTYSFSQDFNNDGNIDASDISIMIGYIKTKNLAGDINDDGRVDNRDLFLMTRFNKKNMTMTLSSVNLNQFTVNLTNIDLGLINTIQIRWNTGSYPTTVSSGNLAGSFTPTSTTYSNSYNIGQSGTIYVTVFVQAKSKWLRTVRSSIEVLAIEGPDISPPNLSGTFVLVEDTTADFNSVKIDQTLLGSDSADVAGYNFVIKNLQNSDSIAFTLTTPKDTIIALNGLGVDFPSNDLIRSYVIPFDEVPNYGTALSDTLVRSSDYITIVPSISRSLVTGIDVRYSYDGTTVRDSSHKVIPLSELDISVGGDTIRVPYSETFRAMYVSMRVDSAGSKGDWSSWLWQPTPTLPSSFVISSPGVDSVLVQVSGWGADADLYPDSVRIQYSNSSYPTSYTDGTNLYAGAFNQLAIDNDLFFPTFGPDATMYANLWVHRNGVWNESTIQDTAVFAPAAPGFFCSNLGETYSQSFEGTGYAANGSWGDEVEVEQLSGSVVNEDYTSIVQCGSQSLYMAVTTAYGKANIDILPSSSSSIFYFRFYLYVLTDGLADGGYNTVLGMDDINGRGSRVRIVKSGSQLQLRYDYYNGSTFAWTNGTPYNISTGTWYRVEGYFNATGSNEGWEFRINGITHESGTDNTLGGFDSSTNVGFGLDPSDTNTMTIITDGFDISITDWIGE